MHPPLLYRIYVAASVILVPFAAWFETRKLRRTGVSVPRAHEKLGHATAYRQGVGPLVWFHAASVGESMSVLAVITEMAARLPRAQFLITSGTPTSADMVARNMPPRTVHQFAPLDAPGPVDRFIRHWRPNAAVFVESEIWPQMLRRTKASGARMVLVNARLSQRSQAAWQARPNTARYVLDSFDLILTQNDEMAEAMVAMQAPAERVARGMNLKALGAPLPQQPEILAQARTALKGRPVWVAASTHKGEETQVLSAHARLLSTHPDLLLILVPRHPDRSAEVAQLTKNFGLSYAVRSEGEMVEQEAIYLADTLGELGNWYALAQVVFLGGSLEVVGGHNPYEVALSGHGVLSGPHTFNFSETFADMLQSGAAQTVSNADELSEAVDASLRDLSVREARDRAARDFVRGKAAQVGTIADRLIKALDLEVHAS